jgi:RNA polymerase sigma-70 factor (ECF subfamily)
MDSEKMRALLELHHAESFGWARCCCRQDRAEGENVLQAAYLKVLEHRAVFDGRSEFRTWLFSVIRNTASETRRLRFLQRVRLIQYKDTETRKLKSPTPEEALYRSEVEQTMRAALARLPRRQCEVLQLVFYHELSLAEAAKVMRVSIGSARTHYERGKRRLRSWIEEKGMK